MAGPPDDTPSGQSQPREDVYDVVLHEGQWKILWGGKHFGPFSTMNGALRTAVETADSAGRTFRYKSMVRVQGPDGKLEVRWTYGQSE